MGPVSREELSDAVHRAALAPEAWNDVMRLAAARFPSSAQAFYVLDVATRRVRPVALRGIEPVWLRSFDTFYFTADNPWMRLSNALHRPGVVRTNERLDACLRQEGTLYRSAYFHDWMRPQGFRFTIGSTLYRDEQVIANVTLLREPGRPTFDDAEVREFEALDREMSRAIAVGVRLGEAGSAGGASLLDALDQPALLVDAERRVLHANAAMETLLRRRDGLAVRGGRLDAVRRDVATGLAARIASVFGAPSGGDAAALALPSDRGPSRRVRIARVASATAGVLPAVPTAILIVDDAPGESSSESLRRRFGCTPVEARLVAALLAGRSLREAGDELGVTYGTVRGYLKSVFQKTGARRQSELVARVSGTARP